PIHGDLKPEIAIISSLGKHVDGQYVLVRIHDDQGRIGLGEASVTCVWSGETQAGAIALLKDFFSPLLTGADPFDIEWISRRLDKTAHVNSFAKGAIEMALLDLQGQTLGLPVYRLLGGKASPEGPANKEFQGPGEIGIPTRDGIRLK